MTYLEHTEFAAKQILDLLTVKGPELLELREQLENLQAKFDFEQWDFSTSENFDDDFSDVQIQGKFERMAKTSQELQQKKAAIAKAAKIKEVEKAGEKAANLEHSLQVLAGALLQLAKQGLSSAHGAPTNIASHRDVAGLPVHQVIWTGRNQSLHFEEADPRSDTKEVFDQLAVKKGDAFNLSKHPKRNMALDVVQLLGWNSYENYKDDMEKLLVPRSE